MIVTVADRIGVPPMSTTRPCIENDWSVTSTEPMSTLGPLSLANPRWSVVTAAAGLLVGHERSTTQFWPPLIASETGCGK
jgi:hypothetical protein